MGRTRNYRKQSQRTTGQRKTSKRFRGGTKINICKDTNNNYSLPQGEQCVTSSVSDYTHLSKPLPIDDDVICASNTPNPINNKYEFYKKDNNDCKDPYYETTLSGYANDAENIITEIKNPNVANQGGKRKTTRRSNRRFRRGGRR